MIKDFVTTESFWDCECQEGFIHPKSEKCCNRCGAKASEQPDSRLNEVMNLALDKINQMG